MPVRVRLSCQCRRSHASKGVPKPELACSRAYAAKITRKAYRSRYLIDRASQNSGGREELGSALAAESLHSIMAAARFCTSAQSSMHSSASSLACRPVWDVWPAISPRAAHRCSTAKNSPFGSSREAASMEGREVGALAAGCHPRPALSMIDAHTIPVVVLPRPIWQLKTRAVSFSSPTATGRKISTSWVSICGGGALSSAMGSRW
mmetsp:Transcript_24245/g.55135  ORF Transcript_24245/g.55135 Transcript_24245/m.55135 type:complete len:206 (-) Transcript_24245:162-779(-)